MHGKAWRDAVFDPFVEIVPATPSRFGLLVFVSLRPSATMCLLGQQARQNPSRDVREHSLSTKVIKKNCLSYAARPRRERGAGPQLALRQEGLRAFLARFPPQAFSIHLALPSKGFGQTVFIE
jgi:hypothetical protein